MAEETDKLARSEAARLMGSVMTPAKRAAVIKAAQFGGRKKGTLQSESTKAKIRATRLAQEAAKRAARGESNPALAEPKRPRGRPRKVAEAGTDGQPAAEDQPK